LSVPTALFEQVDEPLPVANVNILMGETLAPLEQPVQIPPRVSCWAEEFSPQIVIDAKHAVA
jgi:hypothetical protein